MRDFLIEMLAVERQAHAAEQQARVAVVGRGRVEDDVDAGDHLWGIAISSKDTKLISKMSFLYRF